jgi:hypothetical protein
MVLLYSSFTLITNYNITDQNSELLRLLESEESLTASLQAETAECRSELGKIQKIMLYFYHFVRMMLVAFMISLILLVHSRINT